MRRDVVLPWVASRWAVFLCIAWFLCWTLTAPLAAQPEDYARHWPVQMDEAGIYAVTLTPALYRQIQSPELKDLAAFNESGESLGFEPLASVLKAAEPQWSEAVWFALPTPEYDQEEGLSFQVERRSDGSLRVQGEVGGSTQPVGGGDLLVDTGIDIEGNVRLLALTFELQPHVTDFSARIRIEASHDLESWRTLVASTSLLQLQQDGQLLERRRIELPGSRERYLRLRRLDGDAPLPLSRLEVQAQAAAVLEPPPTERLAAELVSQEGRTFVYRLPARIPIEQVNLRLAKDNTVSTVSLAAREDDEDAWRPRGSWTAFRLRAEGVELESEPQAVGGRRDRQWRVIVGSDLAEPPNLEFSYRPERWLLLTQGEVPYVIAAGSARAVRSAMPVAALLEPIRNEYGDAWQPSDVALGEPVLVGGDAATDVAPEGRGADLALWLVLIGSALAIGYMVLRLMRESPGENQA